VRIVIVDDSDAFRQRVTRHLAQNPEIEVVGEAADGEAALRVIEELRPDVVILDLFMPTTDGFGVLRQLKRGAEPVKVIVLTNDLSTLVHQRCASLRADAVIDKADTGLQLLPILRLFQ
jgi:DNA-binding NarL/FixJ family response regulator